MKNKQTSFPDLYRVEILKNPKIIGNLTLFKKPNSVQESDRTLLIYSMLGI